jgi:mitochondrial fission process protein 1
VEPDTRRSILFRALPAFTIHTAVSQARKAFKNARTPRVKAWGPTLTGLAIVPVLPYIFDHPVEEATDRAFGWLKSKMIAYQDTKKNSDS